MQDHDQPLRRAIERRELMDHADRTEPCNICGCVRHKESCPNKKPPRRFRNHDTGCKEETFDQDFKEKVKEIAKEVLGKYWRDMSFRINSSKMNEFLKRIYRMAKEG
jgi:hypothetical protein